MSKNLTLKHIAITPEQSIRQIVRSSRDCGSLNGEHYKFIRDPQAKVSGAHILEIDEI